MLHVSRATLLISVALLTTGPAAATDSTDDAMAVLAFEAERPPDPGPVERPELRDVPTATRLFYMRASDHVRVVRSIADVTGDGRDEIIVGIDESQSDNIFCLDGASSGLATLVWSAWPISGLSNGSPYGDESIVPISDPDANGFQNILVGTAWGGRSAHNVDGLDGAVIWTFDTYDDPPNEGGWVYSLAELNDITGDGVPEVAFGAGSNEDSVTMVDGASTAPGQATMIWQYQAADAAVSVRNIGDVNGDGHHDLVAAIGDSGYEVVCLDGGTVSPNGSVLWHYPAGDSVFSVGVLPDITEDGIDEALVAVWTAGGDAVRCVNGATGTQVWSSTQVANNAMAVNALPDVTGDGIDEVIVASWENAVIVLNGINGEQLWKTTVGTLNNGYVWTARAIADISGDGVHDVVAGSFDEYAYAMDGKNGTIIWKFNTFNRVYSVYPVGDLTGDGFPEVVVGNQNLSGSPVVAVHVLDGGSGLIVFNDGFESGDTSAWSNTVP